MAAIRLCMLYYLVLDIYIPYVGIKYVLCRRKMYLGVNPNVIHLILPNAPSMHRLCFDSKDFSEVLAPTQDLLPLSAISRPIEF